MILLLAWCAGLSQPITLRFTNRARAIDARDLISRAADRPSEMRTWCDDHGGEVQIRLRHLVALQVINGEQPHA